MELRHLRYFVAVAEELHFTRAAERLHIGQPPLSHQIQMLEAQIGTTLLDRTKRWVRLTDAGRLFLDDARRILALSEHAVETARRADRGEVGEIRIGFTPSTPFTVIFPTVIKRYRKHFPHVTLALQEMSTIKQIDAIAESKLDVGFVRPPERDIPAAVCLTTLRRDPLSLVMPVDHPLAKRKSVPLKALADESFVMYAREVGTGIYPLIMRLCRESGFEPNIMQTAQEASTIIGLVAAGCGIAILPESFNCIRVKGICYRPLTGQSAFTALLLANRTGKPASLADSFINLAIEAARQA